MEENVKGNQPISIVDPEAHSILDKSGEWGFNYNFQAGVDDKYGMIAVHYITQSPNDQKELLITVNELNKRYGYNIQLVMITLEALGTDSYYVDERERAMTCMEKTIQASLRSVDVSTRYGSEQFVVILLNAGSEYIETITKRIEENVHKIYSKVKDNCSH